MVGHGRHRIADSQKNNTLTYATPAFIFSFITETGGVMHNGDLVEDKELSFLGS